MAQLVYGHSLVTLKYRINGGVGIIGGGLEMV